LQSCVFTFEHVQPDLGALSLLLGRSQMAPQAVESIRPQGGLLLAGGQPFLFRAQVVGHQRIAGRCGARALGACAAAAGDFDLAPRVFERMHRMVESLTRGTRLGLATVALTPAYADDRNELLC
jgi:hypothetical protein